MHPWCPGKKDLGAAHCMGRTRRRGSYATLPQRDPLPPHRRHPPPAVPHRPRTRTPETSPLWCSGRSSPRPHYTIPHAPLECQSSPSRDARHAGSPRRYPTRTPVHDASPRTALPRPRAAGVGPRPTRAAAPTLARLLGTLQRHENRWQQPTIGNALLRGGPPCCVCQRAFRAQPTTGKAVAVQASWRPCIPTDQPPPCHAHNTPPCSLPHLLVVPANRRERHSLELRNKPRLAPPPVHVIHIHGTSAAATPRRPGAAAAVPAARSGAAAATCHNHQHVVGPRVHEHGGYPLVGLPAHGRQDRSRGGNEARLDQGTAAGVGV